MRSLRQETAGTRRSFPPCRLRRTAVASIGQPGDDPPLPMRLLRSVVAAIAAVLSLPSQQVLTPEGLVALQRVSELALSPDGKHLLFTVRTVDLAENRNAAKVWLLPLATGKPAPVADGSQPVWLGNSQEFAFATKDGVVRQPLAGG